MDNKFFVHQFERLVETFGEKNYGRERVNLIWKEVNQLSNEWFRDTIDEFIGSERYAPLLPQFREKAAQERERIWREQKKKLQEAEEAVTNYLCMDCRGTGAVQAWIGNENNYTFRCHCEAGQRRPEKNWPVYRNQLRAVK